MQVLPKKKNTAICCLVSDLLNNLLNKSTALLAFLIALKSSHFCLLRKKKSPTDVWNQSFIAEYYIKHCSQDLTSLKTIIVQQLCYNTQYGI